jgi:PAS domain S-box-containing protein
MTPLTILLKTLNAELQDAVAELRADAGPAGEQWRRLLVLAQESMQAAQDGLERQRAEHSELLRLNQTIAKNEARFRQVVEASPNAMVMINATGQIEMVNAQTERLFGYSRSELLGRGVEILLPVEFRADHPRLRQRFFTELVTRAMGVGKVLFGLRKDGSKFEVEIGLNPIETDEGTMVLSSIVDISERVRLAAQLLQSQKMDAIGRVSAGVAHDFNNLLQALGNSLDLLRDAVADQPAARQWIDVALRAAERGGQLTSRLLAFSRQQVLTSRPVEVGSLLAEVRELITHLFETKAGETKNEIVVVPGPAHLSVFADPGQLEAALINLALNARDAMPTGGRLYISAYAADADPEIVPPGRYTVISVADTGVGMDQATLSMACEPFFTTKGIDGTGLGLSMVLGFARQSGGEAHIVSVPGEGTTVELWLPSAGQPRAPLPAEAARPSSSAVRGRVLLVDDSPDVLLTVGSFLRQAGLEVVSLANGDLAVAELLGGRPFDVVITDLAMTGMNGLDVLEQAREIDPAMAGILITGYYGPEIQRGLEHVLLLRKPFNRAELIAHVDRLIFATRQARATSHSGSNN